MRKRALLIGVNEYPLLSHLKYAEADAESVAVSLRRNYGFDESDIVLMTTKQSGMLRPSLAFIEAQLKHIRNVCQNLDFFLVGFWGHGRLSPDQTNRYLCMSDSSEDNLARTSLTYEILQSYLKQISAQNTCLILDCCQTISDRGDSELMTEKEAEGLGRFADQTARDILTSRRQSGLSVFIPPTFAILNSCMPSEKAYEWEERKHGIFTAHLLEGMNQRLDSVGRWSSYISKHVPQTASALGRRQTPFFKQSGAGDIELTELVSHGPVATWDEISTPCESTTMTVMPSVVASPNTNPVEAEAEAIYRQLKAKKAEEARRIEAERIANERLLREEAEEAARILAEQERLEREKMALLRDSGVGVNAGDRMIITVKEIDFALRWCPPGEFTMGSPADEVGRSDSESQFNVTLTHGFWMMETLVTQAMWQGIMENNPSHFKGDNLPVEEVSWNDCQNFISQLNQNEWGYAFHLPTEAQWEYACRAGTTTPYATPSDFKEICWDGCNSNAETHPVGFKRPNAWGLFDMHGNVWEWCHDWSSIYPGEPVTDPTGPEDGYARVIRGGSWRNHTRDCRSAMRGSGTMVSHSSYIGLRLIASPDESVKKLWEQERLERLKAEQERERLEQERLEKKKEQTFAKKLDHFLEKTNTNKNPPYEKNILLGGYICLCIFFSLVAALLVVLFGSSGLRNPFFSFASFISIFINVFMCGTLNFFILPWVDDGEDPDNNPRWTLVTALITMGLIVANFYIPMILLYK